MLVVFEAISRRSGTMTESDVLFGIRLRLFDHAREVDVAKTCRTFGVHRSTYYRWKAQVERSPIPAWGPGASDHAR